jgi:hypothetical protein
MKMSFDSWVKNSWLERLQSDAPEIARLLALADGRLADDEKAVTAKLSADVELGLAYDAIRVGATAALRAAGYRVVRGNHEHYRTIEALEFSIDPERKIILERSVELVRTYPLVIIWGLLRENPFFVPPKQFLDEMRKRRLAAAT